MDEFFRLHTCKQWTDGRVLLEILLHKSLFFPCRFYLKIAFPLAVFQLQLLVLIGTSSL
jgi:hypothetical protein